MPSLPPCCALALLVLTACSDDPANALGAVAIENDFDNDAFERKPPWTICEAHYGGTDFGKIEIGARSAEKPVTPGLGHVYMVAAWDDPTCSKQNALPVASREEEEVVAGQTRIIFINLPNHQGPCPPEGVRPIPRELYDRILALWPDYGFLPYDQRTQNPQCSP